VESLQIPIVRPKQPRTFRRLSDMQMRTVAFATVRTIAMVLGALLLILVVLPALLAAQAASVL
jgi:hypothetical protein